MARADLLVTLVKAASLGDNVLYRRTVEALITEERDKQHHVLADRLAEELRKARTLSPGGDLRPASQNGLFYEVAPRRTLDELVLPEVVTTACRELVEEQHRVELLRSYNLEPRNRILLTGPPGNGKTSLAEAIAESLIVPLITARYEGIIGTYLGETAVRLKQLFDYVRTRRCVLFFDEFDTLGKERGDPHDTGEIKRVVSSLLLQIDDLPSHVVVITATNHAELLDRAVWRRFQLRLRLPKPEQSQISDWLRRFEAEFGHKLEINTPAVAEHLEGASFSELEDFTTDIRRRYVLTLPEVDTKKLVSEQLKLWSERRLTCEESLRSAAANG